MHHQKSKKILIYFFILFLVGSINNIKFNTNDLIKIKNIKVNGLDERENEILSKEIKSLNLKNIFFMNKFEIVKILNKNSLIENYKIFKNYPSSLYINVVKTKLLAKININNKILIIGSNGKISDIKSTNLELPFIFGNPKIEDFLKFKKIIDKSKISYEEIKNLYYFKSKRWDIKLKNNTLLKLPKHNIKTSIDNAFEFIGNENFKDSKIIDARILNQIIIND